jgi:hypothetical protein
VAARSLPAAAALWAEHERLLLEVFTRALRKLQASTDLASNEEGISDRLEDAAREATFVLKLDYPPKRELPRQRVSDTESDGPGSRKRPDFTCEIRDLAATSSAEAWLYYHVECKCLGKPPSRNWVYNRNYVTKGIYRFLDSEFGYGERAFTGAMIGYVLSMSFDEILVEVNGHLGDPSALGATPPIRFLEPCHDGLATADQVLDRVLVRPRHFVLRHMWVDLRRPCAA